MKAPDNLDVTVRVRLSRSDHDRLLRMAEQDGRTLSGMIRVLLTRKVKQQPAGGEKEQSNG